MSVKFHLHPNFFTENEKTILDTGFLSASTFLFDSGVLGLRLKNSRGELVILPYQGMQIWSAHFAGRNLTMKSMFTQPRPTRSYLETYGGFLIHCGFSSMGVPTKDDVHPLHGELPNAPYENACIETGSDSKGDYLSLSAQYEHIVAFSTHYMARPEVKLYAGSSIFTVSLQVENLKKTPMEYMYLAHTNFRPVNGGELIYSAAVSSETVRVRNSIPSHVKPGPGYREFLDELSLHPELHHHITPDLAFDPEVVLFIEYVADENGWAHTLQIHPDGSSDYVRHNPSVLDHGVRWICRTQDQDAMGMILAATAEPEGYLAEKAKGNVKTLAPGAVFSYEMDMGVLNPDQTRDMTSHIKKILVKHQ